MESGTLYFYRHNIHEVTTISCMTVASSTDESSWNWNHSPTMSDSFWK